MIAGQGTIAMEILRQHPSPDARGVLLRRWRRPAGRRGGLYQAVRPDVRIIGVEAVDACAMTQSLEKGERVELEQVGLFADGAAVKYVGQETFRLCQQYVDEMVLVDNDAICAAIKDVFEDTAPSSSPPARWRWPAPSGSSATRCATRPWWRSPPAPT